MKPSISCLSNDKLTISKTSLNNDLIEFVRLNKVLYDFKDPHYTSIEFKNNIWQIFADKYGIEVSDVKQRWNVLRTGFSHAKKRLDNGPLKGKKWEYLDSMLFLKDFLKPNDHLQIPIKRLKANKNALHQRPTEIEVNDSVPQSQQRLFEESISIQSSDSNEQEQKHQSTSQDDIIYDQSNHFGYHFNHDDLLKQYLEDMHNPTFMFLKSLLPSLSKYTDQQLSIVKYRLLGVIIEADQEFKQ